MLNIINNFMRNVPANNAMPMFMFKQVFKQYMT